MQIIETDDRSRVVLTGRPSQRFLVHENEDGSLLLEPAVVLPAAQFEYVTSPALQELLTKAANAPTVRRKRTHRE